MASCYTTVSPENVLQSPPTCRWLTAEWYLSLLSPERLKRACTFVSSHQPFSHFLFSWVCGSGYTESKEGPGATALGHLLGPTVRPSTCPPAWECEVKSVWVWIPSTTWSRIKDSRVFCCTVTVPDFQFLLKFLVIHPLILFSPIQMFEAPEGKSACVPQQS